MDATASELNLFKTLANPLRTNFEKGDSVVSRALEVADTPPSTPPPSTPPPPPPHTPPPFTPPPPRHTRSPPFTPPPQHTPSPPPRHTPSPPPPRPPPNDDEEEDASQKQGMLLELHQLSRDGVQLTRTFTMNDTASDMMFELNRIRSNLDTQSSVSMMTDALQLGMKGVEMANSKWGPVLHLDGWSTTVDQDRERFQRVLTKLYKKHWRRGSMMSPEAELAMLLGGSAFLHHFQCKMGANPEHAGGMFGSFGNIMGMFGGKKSTPPPPPPPPPPVATEGLFTQRPRMRRPNAPPPESSPPSPPPEFELELEALRRERAVLQQQLRQQTLGGFEMVFTPASNLKPSPEIEEL